MIDRDFCIRIVDMPRVIKGVTIPSECGFYNVYLNAKASLLEQLEAMRHELIHIDREDFYNEEAAILSEERAKEEVAMRRKDKCK